MKYLVMETHPAYAVVLDERGRFLKAANLHYQVGQTVEDVVELRLPPPRRRFRPAWGALGALALAACLCLGFFGYWQPNFIPYGTLRIQINPDVELSVSKTDRVLDLRALNADGETLLDGLDLKGEDSDDAVQELVEKAFEKGFLARGGAVSITASSEDDDWQIREEAALQAQLQAKYGDGIAVYLGGAVPEQDAAGQQEQNRQPSSVPAQPESAPPAASQTQPAAPSRGDPQDDWDPTGSDYPYDSDDDALQAEAGDTVVNQVKTQVDRLARRGINVFYLYLEWRRPYSQDPCRNGTGIASVVNLHLQRVGICQIRAAGNFR